MSWPGLFRCVGRFRRHEHDPVLFGIFDPILDVSHHRLAQCRQGPGGTHGRVAHSLGGRIINMGSVFGEAAPAPGLSVYCGTKFAVQGLTRAWSRDLGSAGVTVNNIQPALIQAEPVPTKGRTYEAMKRFISVDRFGKPEEIAEAVAFLANPKAGFINGESLNVDGGWSA
jgi:3-oxoacyl-[acyl-carrier protein] reductase